MPNRVRFVLKPLDLPPGAAFPPILLPPVRPIGLSAAGMLDDNQPLRA